ncbi:MAG TPA: CHAD domain-containing protein [Gemmatimonadaceae bacterium]|jgi:CHAD domain-containing protein/CYTH domain-containing protein|nr:CHAD domain-containing protein [Gemmatimonadaceae bacterium]
MPPRVDNLRESSRRVVRLVALAHLADAASARDRLAVGQDTEALHDFRVALRRFRSWERAFREYTRDELSKKQRRKLRDLARDTGASRDLEVHLAWLAEQRGSLTRRQRPGLTWLLATLDREKADADATLERDVDRRFTRIKTRLERALSAYRETIALRSGGMPLPVESFAMALAPRVLEQARALGEHIAHVHSPTDEAEAHEARIAAKRLRYLLEPVAKLVPGAGLVVERLKSLQDTLGDLHDAQVFGAEVERLAATREREAGTGGTPDNGAASATSRGPALADAARTQASSADSPSPEPLHRSTGEASRADQTGRTAPSERSITGSGEESPDARVIASSEQSATLVPSAVAASAAAGHGHSSATTSAAPPRRAPDVRPGLAAIRERLGARASSAFMRFRTEWSGDASASFFADVDSVAATIAGAGRADVEIERKYLIRAVPDEARTALRLDIDQGYIPGARLHERIRRVTVRHRSQPPEVRYYRTVKLGDGVARTEIEEPTTELIFEAMWPLTKGRRLRKRRYVVPVDGKTWEIDDFKNRDLVLAEIELEAEDEPVTFPPWLAPLVEREVTGEAAYQNINLAK